MNEPAFPMFKPRIENYCEEEVIPGMTLRDYFAAKAMQGLCANPNIDRPKIKGDPNHESFASVCYEYADAMLKSRTEPKGEYMENKEINIYEFLKADEARQNKAWYDWFCKETSLPAKTKKLVRYLRQIVISNKFDATKTYTFFKNNCPCNGRLYDDFRICDVKTGDVLYTIIPSNGHNSKRGQSEVWGKENDFKEAIVEGTWKEVKEFFNNAAVAVKA